MKNKVIEIVTGGSGIALTEIVETLPPISGDDIGTIGNLLIQIAIAVATIFKLFKRKK